MCYDSGTSRTNHRIYSEPNKESGRKNQLVKKNDTGAVQSFETFEITKARISQSLDAKGKCQIQRKIRRTKKST